MNARAIPAPPDRCEDGHDYIARDCTACEDLANWHEDYRLAVESDPEPTEPTEGAFQIIRDRLAFGPRL